MIKKCECCGKEIKIVFGSTKYCSKCSIHTKSLREEINNLRLRIEYWKKKKGKGKNDICRK